MPTADQTGWLILCIIFGVAGFALLGYVHVWLAEGKRFKEQLPQRKRVIVCVSLAQWPYMFIGMHGAFTLISAWWT